MERRRHGDQQFLALRQDPGMRSLLAGSPKNLAALDENRQAAFQAVEHGSRRRIPEAETERLGPRLQLAQRRPVIDPAGHAATTGQSARQLRRREARPPGARPLPDVLSTLG